MQPACPLIQSVHRPLQMSPFVSEYWSDTFFLISHMCCLQNYIPAGKMKATYNLAVLNK